MNWFTCLRQNTANSSSCLCMPICPIRRNGSSDFKSMLKAGSLWEDRDLVITDLHGGYFNPRYLEKLFRKIIAEAGLPPMPFHNLRHSAATLLLSMGVPLKVIQEILGHSN